MRRTAAVLCALLAAGIALPATADHTPVNETPDYHVVDGTPICGVEGSGAPPAYSGTGIEVGSYNILHSQSEDDVSDVSERFDLVVDAMEAADADVWGLQEVTNNTEHGNQAQKIAAELASRTGLAWEWCWSWSNPHFPGEPDVLPGGGGPLSLLVAQFSNLPEIQDGNVESALMDFKEGLGVVSRYDIDEDAARFRRLQPRAHEALACPVSPNPLDLIGCQLPAVFDHRQVLHTPIVAAGGRVDVFNTHLAHQLTDHSDETKYHQIEKSLDTIDEWAGDGDGLPEFFTGDFNTDAAASTTTAFGDTARYQLLIDAGFGDTYADAGEPECRSNDLDTTEGCTAGVDVVTPGPTQDPSVLDERIDYVWARGDGCALTTSESVILGTNTRTLATGDHLWPSDHLGVASSTTCNP